MKTQLNKLLDAGEDLIGHIEDVRDSVERQLSEIGGAANAIELAVRELGHAADDLHRRICDVRKAGPHLHDPVAAATMQAIDNLLKLLSEAKSYFESGNTLAAYGTLVLFDEHTEDLRAAFRLCQMRQRPALRSFSEEGRAS